MKPLRIAYIGCGAVVQRSHLPALMNVTEFNVTSLIDFNEEQRNKLAQTYNVKYQGASFNECLEHFDIAVIATPSASHYLLAKELLEAGKHVLVEKPLAIEYTQACELVELAKKQKKVLSVSLVRRFLPHFKLFASLLHTQVVGQVKEFNIEEGGVFNWPVQGAGFFNHKTSGGGVLMDNGAHLLDACLWWLGDYSSVEYKDDAQGGVDAECHLNLNLVNGASGSITMSRLRNLSNRIEVIGDKGRISMELGSGYINLMVGGESVVLSGNATIEGARPEMNTLDLFEYQYRELYREIALGADQVNAESADIVRGNDCLESIRLISQCYENREVLPFIAG